jgi:hypothetical protein
MRDIPICHLSQTGIRPIKVLRAAMSSKRNAVKPSDVKMSLQSIKKKKKKKKKKRQDPQLGTLSET